MLNAFGIDPAPVPRMDAWKDVCERIRTPEGEVTIAIVGKYTGLKDAYKSLIEALHHGGMANRVKVKLEWIESEVFEKRRSRRPISSTSMASSFPAALANAAQKARFPGSAPSRVTRKVPYFGICFGMQMAVIEAARNLAGIKDASSTEFDRNAAEPVVGLMTEWVKGNTLEKRTGSDDLGGTMRLGAYKARLAEGTKIAEIYGSTEISERHRHRYEVNFGYRDKLESCGLVFSGTSPDGVLPETIEYADHPWFIGVQYHPELKSRPLAPHPLFASFVEAALEQSRLV